MREGLIPVVLGTAVTAAGITLKFVTFKDEKPNGMMPMFAAGVIGFGLAHIVLGAIDLFEE
jgi:uncharacterized membrane protein HdeD (DUF308 family)